ncbi:hypothetical protein D9M69_375870 [compost metagenome]
MKPIKALLIVAALSGPSLALAEGGADRTFARMEAARQAVKEAERLAADSPAADGETTPAKHVHC